MGAMTVEPSRLAPIHDRRDEEPRGRWENRCDRAQSFGMMAEYLLTCDRPTGHKGMHTGRLWDKQNRVVGYAKERA